MQCEFQTTAPALPFELTAQLPGTSDSIRAAINMVTLQAWRAGSQLFHRNTTATPGEETGPGYCLTLYHAQSDWKSEHEGMHPLAQLLAAVDRCMAFAPGSGSTAAFNVCRPLTEHVLYAAFMYVLVPMPWLFFGQADSGSSSIYGGSSLASGWIDAGKFFDGILRSRLNRHPRHPLPCTSKNPAIAEVHAAGYSI